MKKTILVTAPYMLPVLERFRPVFDHYELGLIPAKVSERLSEKEIMGYSGQFDGIICGDDQFSEEVIKACLPRLKVISKWGTGIDSIDCKAAHSLGILVKNTPNAFTLPVADSVMGYILAFARQQPWMDRQIKKGSWEKIMGCSLSECSLGVIGMGNIGKAVLRRARAFGMRLLGNDIVAIAPDFILENKVEVLSLRDLLNQADFVSLNCDLNPTSRHLINTESLSWMRANAVLINTSRGQVVDEPALVAALKDGWIRGAAMDVFEMEPVPTASPLLSMDNVMLAPHNSNSSPAAWERVHWNTIRNLLEGLDLNIEDLERFLK